jgi:hypothetical protein
MSRGEMITRRRAAWQIRNSLAYSDAALMIGTDGDGSTLE